MKGVCKVCGKLIKSGKLIIDSDGKPICVDCKNKGGKQDESQ